MKMSTNINKNKIINKNNILDSWIMVEHLSEGDINTKDKKLYDFAEIQNGDYYSFINSAINKDKIIDSENGGFAIYFDVFPFQNTLDILRDINNLKPTEEEITNSSKFSFVLFFDNNFKIIEEMSFCTASYYIKEKKEVPTLSEFIDFEEKKNDDITKLFCSVKNNNVKSHFNCFLSRLLEINGFSVDNCKFKTMTNIYS